MSELQRMRQESMELGRQLGRQLSKKRGRQEVARTLAALAEQGKISQEAMQTILSKI